MLNLIEKDSYEEIHHIKSETHGFFGDEVDESYTKVKHSHPKSRKSSRKGFKKLKIIYIYILDKLQFVAFKSLILNINNISKKTHFDKGNCTIKNHIGHIRIFRTSY